MTGTVWLGEAGYRFTTHDSPISIWPGGDIGRARDVLLRAHPLLDGGVISGGVFGHRLAYGSVEIQRWRGVRAWPIRIAPAAFVDLARATHGLASSDTRLEVDAGAGLRLALPGWGVVQIDLAHGLRDGKTALSFGLGR